jgi:hypothetical protein
LDRSAGRHVRTARALGTESEGQVWKAGPKAVHESLEGSGGVPEIKW